MIYKQPCGRECAPSAVYRRDPRLYFEAGHILPVKLARLPAIYVTRFEKTVVEIDHFDAILSGRTASGHECASPGVRFAETKRLIYSDDLIYSKLIKGRITSPQWSIPFRFLVKFSTDIFFHQILDATFNLPTVLNFVNLFNRWKK